MSDFERHLVETTDTPKHSKEVSLVSERTREGIQTEASLGKPRAKELPEQPTRPRPGFGTGEFSVLSFLGHVIPLCFYATFISCAAYMAFVAYPLMVTGAEFTLAFSAIPLLPYFAIGGVLIGLLWAYIESASGD